MDNIPSLLDQVIAFVNANLMPMVASAAIVVEIIVRLLKTEQPLSVAWVVQKILAKVAELAGKLAEFLDKILPQRLK